MSAHAPALGSYTVHVDDGHCLASVGCCWCSKVMFDVDPLAPPAQIACPKCGGINTVSVSTSWTIESSPKRSTER